MCPPSPRCSRCRGAPRRSDLPRRAEHARGDEGAFTGEVSPRMVRDCGLHACDRRPFERRQLFGESDDNVARKALAAFRPRAHADRLRGRDAGRADANRTMEWVERQLERALAGRCRRTRPPPPSSLRAVWAIGNRDGNATRSRRRGARLHSADSSRAHHGECPRDRRCHPLRRQRQARHAGR